MCTIHPIHLKRMTTESIYLCYGLYRKHQQSDQRLVLPSHDKELPERWNMSIYLVQKKLPLHCYSLIEHMIDEASML